MSRKDHKHKVRRFVHKKGPHKGLEQFFCVESNCDYRKAVQLTLGKEFVCWRCGKLFIMNEAVMRLVKPHCPSCTRGRESVNEEIRHEAADAITNLKDRMRAIPISVVPRSTPIEDTEDESEDEGDLL